MSPSSIAPRSLIDHVGTKMATDERPHFKLPVISDNKGGWGPSNPPEKFKDVPYQPFSKGDKLGKVKQMNRKLSVLEYLKSYYALY